MVLSVNMCGMAVTIWSTCGFERKYVSYGRYQLGQLDGFERTIMCDMAATNLVNL